MPKSVDIAEFAVKLDLVCKRLNWSRAKLAQEVAIDKSLAGRWLRGASRPSGNTLMRLNQAVHGSMPSFSAVTWDLATVDFAAQLGLADRHDPMPRPPSPAPIAAITGLHALARFARDIDEIAPVFCGFYRLWFASLIDDGGVMVRRARAFRQADELRCEIDGAWQQYSGIWFVFDRVVYIILETSAGEGVSVGMFKGPFTNRPRRQSGFVMSELRGLASGGIGATPIVAEFIAPLTGDAEADAAAWSALTAENRHITLEALGKEVPGEILHALAYPSASVVRRPERQVSPFIVEPID